MLFDCFRFLAALDFLLPPGVPGGGGAGVSGRVTEDADPATLNDRLRPLKPGVDGTGMIGVSFPRIMSSSGRMALLTNLGVRRTVSLSGRKRFGMRRVSSSRSRIVVAISVYPGSKMSLCPKPSEMRDFRSGV